MTQLSRNLVVAGLAFAGGEAMATTPMRIWQHATHFVMDCRIDGSTVTKVAALCARLVPVAAKQLSLPHRKIADAGGVTLVLRLEAGTPLRGTLHAQRASLEGETEERTPDRPVVLDAQTPEPGFDAALRAVRTPSTRTLRGGVRPLNLHADN